MSTTRPVPEWFRLSEQATAGVMSRIANTVTANQMSLQIRQAPKLAHWFLLDSLLLANRANRDGMHANALALTRQCLEALSIVELGICDCPAAESALLDWDRDGMSQGNLRAWLEKNVWPSYGLGLWNEPWAVFMRQFAGALQPYAHYGSKLAQWQVRLLPGVTVPDDSSESMTALVEVRPRAYDAQKATRITLFHALLTYVLGRVWIARFPNETDFSSLISNLGVAIGKSAYLDGHATDWSQQFWAMLWRDDGEIVLE